MATSQASFQLAITLDEDGAFLNTFTDFKRVTLFKKVTFHRHLLGEQGVSVLKLYGLGTAYGHVLKEMPKTGCLHKV